jgi:uncharacterized membrane protein YhhN
MTSAQQGFAGLQFVLAIGAVSLFLWSADTLAFGQAAIWVGAITASLWALGRFMQGRLHWLEVLTLQSGALATLGALGMVDLAMVFKPMTMVFAIIFVAVRARSTGSTGRFDALLVAALVFSLGGDVFLMFAGGQYFIPGLASFLVAHVFYIALFRQGLGWFPSKRGLAVVLAVGALMYAIVYPGLPDPVLKGAVAAYVTVISLMASQALGRATVLGDNASRWVAAGACVFMVSDSLIALDKFVTPLPLASLWILITYYCAQMLIVHHARPAVSRP